MTYKITSECISCNLCQSVCPTGAIKTVNGNLQIDSDLCTNCVGSVYTVSQCKAVCPTSNGCRKQPADYWESWFQTYDRMVGKLTKKQNYWENWFNLYAQKFSEQLEQRSYEV